MGVDFPSFAITFKGRKPKSTPTKINPKALGVDFRPKINPHSVDSQLQWGRQIYGFPLRRLLWLVLSRTVWLLSFCLHSGSLCYCVAVLVPYYNMPLRGGTRNTQLTVWADRFPRWDVQNPHDSAIGLHTDAT